MQFNLNYCPGRPFKYVGTILSKCRVSSMQLEQAVGRTSRKRLRFFIPLQPLSLHNTFLGSPGHLKPAAPEAPDTGSCFGIEHPAKTTRDTCMNHLLPPSLSLGAASCSSCSAEGPLLSGGHWSAGGVRRGAPWGKEVEPMQPTAVTAHR